MFFKINPGVYIVQVNHIIPPPLAEISILHPEGGKFLGNGMGMGMAIS